METTATKFMNTLEELLQQAGHESDVDLEAWIDTAVAYGQVELAPTWMCSAWFPAGALLSDADDYSIIVTNEGIEEFSMGFYTPDGLIGHEPFALLDLHLFDVIPFLREFFAGWSEGETFEARVTETTGNGCPACGAQAWRIADSGECADCGAFNGRYA